MGRRGKKYHRYSWWTSNGNLGRDLKLVIVFLTISMILAIIYYLAGIFDTLPEIIKMAIGVLLVLFMISWVINWFLKARKEMHLINLKIIEEEKRLNKYEK